MNHRSLLHKNITFYARYYKLVALAALIMVAVIVGSLMVGDSVRTTLVKRVSERLGETETVLYARNAFLGDSILSRPAFQGSARGVLLTNGFVSHQGKLIPVTVWGVDHLKLARGSAKINAPLATELALSFPSDIALRLPATGLVPSGSLFVTDNYSVNARMTCSGLVSVQDGGNISLKNEQALPFNFFVNREELAEILGVEHRINLVLSSRHITAEEVAQNWDYALSGMTLRQDNGDTYMTSDRVFLQQEVVETLCHDNAMANRIFAYLANAIGSGDTAIPYSFVTAVDRYQGQTLPPDEIWLSDYAATRLRAQVGDTIPVAFFTAQDLKTLSTDSLSLRVGRIISLQDLAADTLLRANFPGLSNVARCTDWDSDLPLDMSLIQDQDERYWAQYRNTPKALVAYQTAAVKWANAYGHATAIQLAGPTPDLSSLRAEMFGLQRVYPRESAVYAAKNGVNFSGLFLALGFFIILSAALLFLNPLSEMYYQRRHEMDLLKSLGFTRRRISVMLWKEALPIVLGSSAAGVLCGFLYTTLIMWLLGNIWKGATHTEGFSVYPHAGSLLVGFAVSLLIALGLLYAGIHRALKEKKTMDAHTPSWRRRRLLALSCSVATLALVMMNFILLHSIVVFVVVGMMLLITAGLWGDCVICQRGLPADTHFAQPFLMWSSLRAQRKQTLMSFFCLAIGVFIVFAVGLNRKGFTDSAQLKTGTGGYALWGESSVPIYHNMNTQAGRERLSLTDLPAGTSVLQCLRYGADDASCLNLNKVSTPNVLGTDMNALQASDFRIAQNLPAFSGTSLFQEMQRRQKEVYPALVDAGVLTWGLMMQLGDTLWYDNDRGQKVALQLVGTLANSIFQGNILVDRGLFAEIWPETTGSEVFLLKTPDTATTAVKDLLSQALYEYGVRITTTNDRLRQLNTVTDTYLTIFLTLGGIGLLLGIMSFMIVIRQNLAMRLPEMELYRRLGYTKQRIGDLLYREQVLVPLAAIAVGLVSAGISVSGGITNIGWDTAVLALILALLFVCCVMRFVRKSVQVKMGELTL